MDFMKMLLAYMATTFLVAVESTATPSVTPVPTPGMNETPVSAIVTEAPAELTAEPTVSVTPVPVPTISPNPKYHNLNQGDRGTEVRELQEKLIELGYLPEGSADGAYGGQTRNAVRRFQYYNSLQVDGIAGRSTQTNLFENPDVMPYPGDATATPSAEPTPEVTVAPTAEPAEAKAEVTEEPTAEPAEATAKVTEASTENPAEATPEVTAEPAEAKAEVTEEPTEKPAEEKAEVTEEPTEEPAEATTEVTEEPTEEPAKATAEVTEEPTEEPAEAKAEVTEEPTEEPAEATAEITEEPTVEPAEATAEVTEEPTKAPTEKPAEATAEATEEPAEETAVPEETPETEPVPETTEAGPTEIIEDVYLEDEYEDLAGWIVLNDSGAAMQWNALQDGVPVLHSPRMQSREGRIRISLDDVAMCVEGWELTDDGDTIVLEAEGYTIGFFNEEAGLAVTVDGMELSTEPQDFDFIRDGHYIDVDFLTRAMNGTWEWDAEESTLMLRIPGKNVSNATD